MDSEETDDWVKGLIVKSVLEISDQEKAEKMIDAFPEKIPKLISDFSEILLKNIMSIAPNLLEEHRKAMSDYTLKVYKLWKEPIDLLEIYIGIAIEIGEKYNRLNQKLAAEKKDNTFAVLRRLHGRGCQIANEVLILLKSGYPDGAHARWRTLHEVAVTSMFISKHGNDAAEPYLHYNYIESYKAACVHRDCYKGGGEEPLSNDEIAQLKKNRDDLCKKFGPNFDKRNGWALKALGMEDNKKGTTFDVLEKNVGLDHLRPYYKFASNNVHSGTKGIMFNLAQGHAINKSILTGPSYFGLADAGDSTAISLLQITSALLFSKAPAGKIRLDDLVDFNMMTLMQKKIGEAFIEVHNSTKANPDEFPHSLFTHHDIDYVA